MINSGNFEFSFSGLKTALLYELKKDKNWKKRKSEYAYEFQQAVIDVLISKNNQSGEKVWGKKYNARRRSGGKYRVKRTNGQVCK